MTGDGRSLVIRGGTVISMDSERRILPAATVTVQDGAIVSVGPSVEPPDGARVIDATNAVVIPGMVNAHTHLLQVLLRGAYEALPFSDWLRNIYHLGERLTEEHNHISAMLGCGEALLSGVTTVVEHNFLNRSTGLALATIDGMREAGVRMAYARTAMDLGGLAPPAALEDPNAATEAVDALLDALDTADPMLSVLSGPNTPGVSASAELVVVMHRHAHERGLRQSMHLAENDGVVTAVHDRYGVEGVVRWLDGLGVLDDTVIAPHSVALHPDEVETLARRGVHVAHNPVSNMFLGDGVAPVVDLVAAGGNVCLGTDGAASNNAQDMIQVLKMASLLQRAQRRDPAAVPPMEALAMATINGARALGLDGLIGSIEPGKRADLVVIDLDTPHATVTHDPAAQFVYCVNAADVRTVLVDGQVVVDDFALTTMDLGSVLPTARRAAAELVRHGASR
jgi:5-methylthioadenosine/S-adenosylhomocysteine deaminase